MVSVGVGERCRSGWGENSVARGWREQSSRGWGTSVAR
ncbi:hypothetical protein chiPu_0030851, partial [Chiloscyllium punctatum]|nr:hypothetical protein [Chiloscyllium punctatum]